MHQRTKEEHELQEVQFLGHVINGVGIHVDPNKIEAVKNWEAPRTLSEGEEQERAFQTLKDKLCNAPVLALPNGPKDFMVQYYLPSRFGDITCTGRSASYTLTIGVSNISSIRKKELNMRQRRWIDLFSDYDCEIRFHPGKANVVAGK
ncbi:hypothetical protein Tco_0179936 [Tanacetum coccineum]